MEEEGEEEFSYGGSALGIPSSTFLNRNGDGVAGGVGGGSIIPPMSPATAAVASILSFSPPGACYQRGSRNNSFSMATAGIDMSSFLDDAITTTTTTTAAGSTAPAPSAARLVRGGRRQQQQMITTSEGGDCGVIVSSSIVDTISNENGTNSAELSTADGELIFLPPGEIDALSTSEELQNCMQLIALSSDIDGSKQILYQKEDGTYHALDPSDAEAATALTEEDSVSGVADVEVAVNDHLLEESDEGTPVVMGQDGIIYTVNDLNNAAASALDSDCIFKGTPYEVDYFQPAIELSKEAFINSEGCDEEKYVFKINTGAISSQRREMDLQNNEQLSYQYQMGISIKFPWNEDPDMPKKKTVHVDEHCLDYGGSVFHSQSADNPTDHRIDEIRPSPDIQYDKSLKKILIPFGNHGYMRVFGRKSSVDRKIVEKYPYPNTELCRALAQPLFRNHVMQLGTNVLIFGCKFFMVTADHIWVDGKEEVNVAVSEPDQHISVMRELYYNFVEVLGWEAQPLYKEKNRVLNIMDKNQLNLHQCLTCRKSYKSTTTLAAHMDKCKHRDEAQHMSEDDISSDDEEDTRIYTCNHCEEMCFSMGGLNQHLMEKHPQTVEDKIQIKVNAKDCITHCFMCSERQSTADLPFHLIDKHSIKMVNGDNLKCLTCDSYCHNAAHMILHKKNHPAYTLQPNNAHSKSHRRLTPFERSRIIKQGRKAFDISHRCGVCSTVFGSKRQIFQHLITHTNLRPYKCEICEETFTFRRTLIRHSNESHPEVSTQFCRMCTHTFETVSMLKRHVCVKAKGDFPCPYCDWETNMDIRLFRHISREHRHIKHVYFCSYCKESFKSINKLRYHQNTFHPLEVKKQKQNKSHYKTIENELGKSEVGEPLKEEDIVIKQEAESLVYYVNPRLGSPVEKDRSVVCYYCAITFSTKNAMRRHIQHQHPDRPLYKCVKCAIVFKNNASYCDHQRRYHKPMLLMTSSSNNNANADSLPSSDKNEDLNNIAKQVKVCHDKLNDIGFQFDQLQSSGIKCHLCNMYFNTEAVLDQHYIDVHSNDEDMDISESPPKKYMYLAFYTCSFKSHCNLRFDDKNLVKEHLRNAHGVTENFDAMFKEDIIETAHKSGRKPKNSVAINRTANTTTSTPDTNQRNISKNSRKKNKFTCKLCSKKFVSVALYRTHRFSCDGPKRDVENSESISLGDSTGPTITSDCVMTINFGEESNVDDTSLLPESIVCKTDPDIFTNPDEIILRPIKEEKLDEYDTQPTGIIMGTMGDDDQGLNGPELEDIKKEIELNEDCSDIMRSVVRVGEPMTPLTRNIDAEFIAHPESDESFINIDSLSNSDDEDESVSVEQRRQLLAKKKGKFPLSLKGIISDKISEKILQKRQITKPNRRKKASVNTKAESKVTKINQVIGPDAVLKECRISVVNNSDASSSSSTAMSLNTPNISISINDDDDNGNNAALLASQNKYVPRKRKANENLQNSSNGREPVKKRKRRGIQCERCNDHFITQAELTMHIRYDH